MRKFSIQEKYSNLDNSDITTTNIKNSGMGSSFESINNTKNSSVKIDSQTHLDKNFNQTLTIDMKTFSTTIKKNSELLSNLSKNLPYDHSNLDQDYVKDHLYYLPADLVKEKFVYFKNDLNCTSINKGYDHPLVPFYDVKSDQWYVSAATSYSNLPHCKADGIGCGDVLMCYKPLIENYNLKGEYSKTYIQYFTNPRLVSNEEERELLFQLCNEKTLLKNQSASTNIKYENYTYNLKDNNYLYKSKDDVWCKKGEELKCKMNQQFFNQFNKK